MNKLDCQTIRKISALKKSGVYKIYLFNKNKPIPIKRFINIDKSGLLYIGAAEKTTIYYRLNCFLNSINPSKKQNNHSAGNKIKNNEHLIKIIEENNLMFEIIRIKKEIKDYFMKYGEIPPLNG